MWSERISAAKKVVTDKAFMYIPYVHKNEMLHVCCMYVRAVHVCLNCEWEREGTMQKDEE